MTITFGKIRANANFILVTRHQEDELLFEQFAALLVATEAKAVRQRLSLWDRLLSEPAAQASQRAVLSSRSVTERPLLVWKTVEDGAPPDYVLYKNFVWTLDDDLRFDNSSAHLQQRLDQECQKLEAQTQPQPANMASVRQSIPESIRHEVWRRDQGQCARCASRDSLEFDHIVPLAMGGSNTARNLELLCESCNRRKGAKLSVRL
ncbi:MAG: HNH endonuclease [Terriglobales bacterium]